MPEQTTYIGMDNPNPDKPLPPINPLVPDGIENFVPRCVVCTSPVPARRARSRSKDTCGPECHKILRKYRKYCIESSKCLACYHPSTPEERKEFREWRISRGERRDKRGRPPVIREKTLRDALQNVVGIMKGIRAGFLLSSGVIDTRELTDESLRERVELLDTEISKVEKLLAPQQAETA